jgi:GT2 family glycosyltransferase
VWGTSWRQRLRLAPLYVAMRAADGIAGMARAHARVPMAAWQPGLTVIIPERDAPAMLAEALAALRLALAHVHEPTQVVVVVNGTSPVPYKRLRAEYPDIEWVHDDAPLGFAGAIARGLERARHDGTYLLNNDMTLATDALEALLPLRGADVFAIGSQILQQDASGRREETGFTDWYLDGGGVRLFHAPVPAAPDAVAHLCASGGAALFRTALLRRYLQNSRCYDPFYWEDVEWSLRAWRDGFTVLFCPGSRARHRHRATTARFYERAELDRIVERNRLLFDARHGITPFGADWVCARVCELPYASQRELSRLRQAAGVFRRRLSRARAPQPFVPPRLADATGAACHLSSSYSFALRAAATDGAARPRLLFVTPFAAFPPRHGGARRVAELLRGLKTDFDIALVTDEASLYDARSFADFDGLCAVHLVRRDDAGRAAEGADLATRMREHCHPALVAAVAAALRDYRPQVVQVEHAELAPLVRQRTADARWILALHDAYGPADFADSADAARFADDLRAYDALTVCSDEDRALVAHPRITCVPNGGNVAAGDYRPSETLRLLFVGPFRYRPNRDGIVRFLREAWPAIRAAVPAGTLTILGGDEHATLRGDEDAFSAPGVEVLGHRDDVPRLLAASALTINPLAAIRGSAVKLVESLAAGRACVSTADGARGFAASAHTGLVIVPGIADMAAPIIRLLQDAAERHRREQPDPRALEPFGWPHAVRRQRALYDELLRAPSRMEGPA